MNIDINFRKALSTELFVGTTDKGHTISYNYIYEGKLRPLTKENVNNENSKPTKLRMECNFKVTSEMLDLLNSSKIIEVIGRIHHEDAGFYEISFYPLSNFSYELLQDIIVDMCEKYNL